jgi:ribonuclease HII
LRPIIEAKCYLAFGVGIIDNHKIDEVNILQATYLAMHLAIDNLQKETGMVIIN